MKIACYILILLTSTQLSAQNKRDYHWFFGGDGIPGPEFGAIHWDFNQKPSVPGTRDAGLSFGQNNTSISTEDGELLFYSNGCAVANRFHQVMPNGDSINAGDFFDDWWDGDCISGYPGRQGITMLPESCL